MKFKKIFIFALPLSLSFIFPIALSNCSNKTSNSIILTDEQVKTLESLKFVHKYFVIPNQGNPIEYEDAKLLNNFDVIEDKILADKTGTLASDDEKTFYAKLFQYSIFFWKDTLFIDEELQPSISLEKFINRVNTIVEKYSNKSNMWNIFMDNSEFDWNNIVSNEIKNEITSSSFQEVGLNIVFPKCFGIESERTELWKSLSNEQKESLNIINKLLNNWYWITVPTNN